MLSSCHACHGLRSRGSSEIQANCGSPRVDFCPSNGAVLPNHRRIRGSIPSASRLSAYMLAALRLRIGFVPSPPMARYPAAGPPYRDGILSRLKARPCPAALLDRRIPTDNPRLPRKRLNVRTTRPTEFHTQPDCFGAIEHGEKKRQRFPGCSGLKLPRSSSSESTYHLRRQPQTVVRTFRIHQTVLLYFNDFPT